MNKKNIDRINQLLAEEIIDTLVNSVNYTESYKSNNCWYVSTTLEHEDDMLRALSRLLDKDLPKIYDCMIVSESQLTHDTDFDYDLGAGISRNFKTLLKQN